MRDVLPTPVTTCCNGNIHLYFPLQVVFKSQDILSQRYQLQQQLGRTAVGRQTWLATDLASDELVIIKLLAFSPQMQWEELKLFEREAQVLESLNYPRIPHYRGYFDIDKTTGDGIPWFVLVQDYIAGSSLQDALEKGKRFTETEVRSIATQVLEILIYLHELSPPVLHRDIKPSNLILGEDNYIYLVDFGAVQSQGAVTGVTFTVVGTSGYAPLEQFWGRAVPASDLYALGATLIHLSTGISPMNLPHQDSRIQFADKVSLKTNFINWLEQITDLAVEKRFPNASEALNSLKYDRNRTQFDSNMKFAVYNKLNKPNKSKIKLHHSYNKLEINFPPHWSPILSSNTLLTIGTILMIFVAISPILAIILAAIAFISLKNTYIKFDAKQVIIQYKILNMVYQKRIFEVEDILGVFLNSHGIESNYRIRILTHRSHYYVGDGLKEDECIWLGKEIQDWLNFLRNKSV